MGTSLRKPRAEGQAYLSSIALWVLDCESRGPMRGNPADPVQRPLGFSRALYLHLYLRMLVSYVLWCHLSDSTHTGVLSEGECEYRVPNTYRSMFMNAFTVCGNHRYPRPRALVSYRGSRARYRKCP